MIFDVFAPTVLNSMIASKALALNRFSVAESGGL